MSDTLAKKVDPEIQAAEDKVEEIESDNEQMDQETFDALKKCSINDEIAAADFNKKEKKVKAVKKNKKTNKKHDFLDLAQEKGIELKIQYEDKEENRKTYYQKDNNFNNNNEMHYQKGKFYQNNYNRDNNGQNTNKFNDNSEANVNNNTQGGYQKRNYYNPGYNKYNTKKNFQFQTKSKNNKFDHANNMMDNMMYNQMRSNMMNHYQMPNYPVHQNASNTPYNHYDLNSQDPFFNSEKSIEEILRYVFSPEFLNKEIYFRKRIGADGLLDLNHFLNYNKVKALNIATEHIKTAIGNMNPPVVEFFESEGKNFLKIFDWENFQQNLISVEQIQSQKRAFKTQRYGGNMNYITLQNNYFFTPNNSYPNYGDMSGMLLKKDQCYYLPYTMPQMGFINVPFQQNYMPGMNQQFQQPPQDEQVTQQPEN